MIMTAVLTMAWFPKDMTKTSRYHHSTISRRRAKNKDERKRVKKSDSDIIVIDEDDGDGEMKKWR